MLREGERIDDLQYNGLIVIQNPLLYCFTSDAVELANFVSNAKNKKVAELCSGSSVISILIAAKQQPKKICCVELQECMCDMARRSIALNNQQEIIEVFCEDAKNAVALFGHESFDILVVNPPYGKADSGETQKCSEIALSRHEIAIDLKTVVSVSAALLKTKGVFYLVHRFDRLAEIFHAMREFLIEPKELKLLYGKNNYPNSVLIKGVKNGGVGLKLIQA